MLKILPSDYFTEGFSELTKFTVTDRFHGSVDGYDIKIGTVADEQAGIAEFIDHSWCSIGRIEDAECPQEQVRLFRFKESIVLS